MKKFAIFALSALFGSMVLFSCTSAPPKWILQTPQPDSVNTWFVGMSTGPDTATAANDAAANLIAGIMQYLGVKVTVNTSATARASLESYSADITQAVKTESSGRLSGFEVKDKYQTEDKKARTFSVYILASYATAELKKEKQRMEALFQEQIDAVAKPEAEGDSLAKEGKLIDAVAKYIDAASAASGSGIDNADIKLARNVNKARNLLASLIFSYEGNEQKIFVGKSFASPFVVKLSASLGGQRLPLSVGGYGPVADAPLLVSYQVKQASGRLVSKTVIARTDSGGEIKFSPPPPEFVGAAKLTVRIDLQSSIELLSQLPPRYDAQKAALQEDIFSKFIEIPYKVSSLANSIPTGICLVDFGETGERLVGDVSQAALMETLGKEKFQILATPFDPSLLAAMDDRALLAAARSAYGASAARIIYGSVKLVSVRQDGSNYFAQAAGQVRAVELSSGRVLYSADKSFTSVGTIRADAVRSALRDLGAQVFGKDLAASLP